jgi:hypothetical protein
MSEGTELSDDTVVDARNSQTSHRRRSREELSFRELAALSSSESDAGGDHEDDADGRDGDSSGESRDQDPQVDNSNLVSERHRVSIKEKRRLQSSSIEDARRRALRKLSDAHKANRAKQRLSRRSGIYELPDREDDMHEIRRTTQPEIVEVSDHEHESEEGDEQDAGEAAEWKNDGSPKVKPEEDVGDTDNPIVVTADDPHFIKEAFLNSVKSLRECVLHKCLRRLRTRDHPKTHSFWWECPSCVAASLPWEKLPSFRVDRDPASKYVLYCFCGTQISKPPLKSQSKANPGREFYTCAAKHCDFFMWKDCISDLYGHYSNPFIEAVNWLKVPLSDRILPKTKL